MKYLLWTALALLAYLIINEDKSLKTIAKVNDWPDDSGVKGNRR